MRPASSQTQALQREICALVMKDVLPSICFWEYFSLEAQAMGVLVLVLCGFSKISWLLCDTVSPPHTLGI